MLEVRTNSEVVIQRKMNRRRDFSIVVSCIGVHLSLFKQFFWIFLNILSLIEVEERVVAFPRGYNKGDVAVVKQVGLDSIVIYAHAIQVSGADGRKD